MNVVGCRRVFMVIVRQTDGCVVLLFVVTNALNVFVGNVVVLVGWFL